MEENVIIGNDRAISMKLIQEMLDVWWRACWRYSLSYYKQAEAKNYEWVSRCTLLLQIGGKNPEVIVSKEGINCMSIPNEKSIVLRKAAKFIREDILKFSEYMAECNWPPSIEELRARIRFTFYGTSPEGPWSQPSWESQASCSFVFKWSSSWSNTGRYSNVKTFLGRSWNTQSYRAQITNKNFVESWT